MAIKRFMVAALLASGAFTPLSASPFATEHGSREIGRMFTNGFKVPSAPLYAPSNKQQDCLARMVFRESGGEPWEGQKAVMRVILNRVQSPLFPNTICGVVHQRHKVRKKSGRRVTICQFSPSCSSKLRKKPRSRHARQVMARVLEAYHIGENSKVGDALFFKATYLRHRDKKDWRRLRRVATIKGHDFYAHKKRGGVSIPGIRK